MYRYRSFETKATILRALNRSNAEFFALALFSKFMPETEDRNLQNKTNKTSSNQEVTMTTAGNFNEGSEAAEQLRTAPGENHFNVYSPRNTFVKESAKAYQKPMCPLDSPLLQGPIDVNFSSKL